MSARVPIAAPLTFGADGRTGETFADRHIVDLIESVLFTAPGERVMRPQFGSGLLQLVFAPDGDQLATTSQFLVTAALQQWLSDLIEVGDVTIDRREGLLQIEVRYVVRSSGESLAATFERLI